MNKNKLRMRADKLLKNLRQYESYAAQGKRLRTYAEGSGSGSARRTLP